MNRFAAPIASLAWCLVALEAIGTAAAEPAGAPGPAPASAPVRVLVLLSDESAPYREAADALRQTLARLKGSAASVAVLSASAKEARGEALRDSTLVVTVGVAAAKMALAGEGNYPVLSIVIPKQAFEALHCEAAAPARHRCSAVYFDQPLARQLNLIEAALPQRRRIGLVLGPTSAKVLPELTLEAAQRGLSVVQRTITDADQLYPALQGVLPEADLLLAVPDGVVLTTASARSLLVSAYRYQIPVVAFSENYVNAGAMLAVFSTPAQLGRQAAEQIGIEAGKVTLPAPQFPRYYTVRSNPQVARSLGIAVVDEAGVRARLAGMRE